MGTQGTVRFWVEEHGWGVIDSPQTPGGCWTHYSQIRIAGLQLLIADQDVELEWEAPGQDGYPFRTLRTWPTGCEPVTVPPDRSGVTSAYTSTVSITWPADEDQK